MIADTAPAPQPLHVQLMHLQADMAAHLAERQHGPRRAVGRKPSPDNEKRRLSAIDTARSVEKMIVGGLNRRAEISKATQLSDSQVSRALRWLLEAGRIKKAKGCMYIMAPKETTTQDRSPT